MLGAACRICHATVVDLSNFSFSMRTRYLFVLIVPGFRFLVQFSVFRVVCMAKTSTGAREVKTDAAAAVVVRGWCFVGVLT